MNSKTLAAIAVVAIGLLAVAFWVTGSTEQAQQAATTERGAAATGPLFPELLEKANDVAKVTIETAEESLTLSKSGEQWVIENVNNYRINLTPLRDMVRNIALMEKVEKKTANPEFFPRLEVEDVAEGAASRRVTMQDAEGNELASIILGRSEFGTFNTPHQFVRVAGENQVWLVSGNVTPLSTADQWLDKEIVNVANTEPRRVTIRNADGEEVRASRDASGQTSFTLNSLPEGRELKNAAITNEFGRILSSVRFDQVKPADEVELAEENLRSEVTVETFDRLAITTKVYDIEGTMHATLSAEALESEIEAENQRRKDEVAAAAEETSGDEEQAEEEIMAPTEPELIDLEAVKTRAQEINDRASGWVYTIPTFVSDRLSRKNEWYLAELPSEETADGEDEEEFQPNLDALPLPDAIRQTLQPEP